MRKLFICCDKQDYGRFKGKVNQAFGKSVEVVEDIKNADLVYVIGKISPDMKARMEQFQDLGIKTVHVNENLINETVYENILKGKFYLQEKGR